MRLQNHGYVLDNLLDPAVRSLAATGFIDSEETTAFSAAGRLGVVKAGDLTEAIPGTSTQRSRAIRTLLDKGLLRTAQEGPRFYQLNLSEGPLAISMARQLNKVGMLPRMLAND